MEPKIPTLKDSQKPQVKVRGLEAGVTLFDRLKQFKKKDLAFILAGLGTLFMAPLAEHFMMAPEGGDSSLNPGFGSHSGSRGLFDNGSGSGSVGVEQGLAPGNAIGGGSDVITPLNVRDPSALVMGPGATQQPPTNSVAPASPPPTAPVTRSDSDLKDALAASGASAAHAASRAAKALMPVPKIALSGSGGLRGLGVSNGGSSASASLGPISSNGLASGKADTRGGLGGVKGGSNIKGVARGQSQGGGGLEGLKAAANNAGDVMNRGAASTALDNAASQAIPAGGSGFGGGGQGGAGTNDKAEGGNQGKDNKSTGESLEFLKQKAMQEKKIELWAKEQEAGDNKLELLKIRNSMAEAIAGKIGGAVGDAITCPLSKSMKKCWGPAPGLSRYTCTPVSNGVVGGTNFDTDSGQVGTDGPGGCKGASKDGGDSASFYIIGTDLFSCSAIGTRVGANCNSDGDAKAGKGGTGNKPGPGSVGSAGSASDMMSKPSVKDLAQACKALDDLSSTMGKLSNPDVQAQITQIKNYADNMKIQAVKVVSLRDAVNGPVSQDCGAPSLGVTDSLIHQQNELLKSISEPNPTDNPYGLIPQLAKSLAAGDPAKPDDGKGVDASKLPDSKTQLDAAIQATDADVKKIMGTKPELVPAVGPDVFKKVYATVYRLPADQQAEQVSAIQGVFAQVNEARGTVVKSANTVIAIQKDLNSVTNRLDAASGPGGTVAKLVPIGPKITTDMRDETFKSEGFTIGKVVPVSIDKGGAAGGLQGLITTANTDVNKGSEAFKAYKEKLTAAGADPAAKKAVHDDATTGFTPTNGTMGTGMASLNKARQAQSNELGSIQTMARTNAGKLAAPGANPAPSAPAAGTGGSSTGTGDSALIEAGDQN